MKIPTSKAELVVSIKSAEKYLQDLVERKLPRSIPGISATLPSPTQPITREESPSSQKEKEQ